MTAILSGLEGRGLIRRDQDPIDGRRHLVSLTPAARTWITGARRSREAWLARALQERFTTAERQTIGQALALLDRLAADA
jgi:DNA-binding MarR family transcriptional regulator